MNTLPASCNIKRLDSYVEAIIICLITKKMMICNNSTIVYFNDGSRMSRVGNFVVQSVTINGKQQTLLTMSIFTVL